MSTVYLNGEFLPMHEARISPMDRGFLFGDGIYEVIPSYGGRTVGLGPHLTRLQQGLQAIGMVLPDVEWTHLIEQLLDQNGRGNLGVYLHVSRTPDVFTLTPTLNRFRPLYLPLPLIFPPNQWQIFRCVRNIVWL